MDFGGLVLQPPLPLQEFLPLQPLSLDAHPPWPLQEFWPLQACLSDAWGDPGAPETLSVPSKVLVPELGRTLDAWTVAPAPASKPASAAPATNAIFDFVMLRSTPSIEIFGWVLLHLTVRGPLDFGLQQFELLVRLDCARPLDGDAPGEDKSTSLLTQLLGTPGQSGARESIHELSAFANVA